MSYRRYIVLSLDMMESCKYYRKEFRTEKFAIWAESASTSITASTDQHPSFHQPSEYEIAQKDISGVIEADVFFLPR
jgi:hypothetical protein